MTLDELIELAAKEDIEVITIKTRTVPAISREDGLVGYDPEKLETEAEKKHAVAHEIGHVLTDAFYNLDSPLDVRAKCEYKADTRAAFLLIPPNQLRQAISKGCTEYWQLADEFQLPEPFIRRVCEIYKSKEYL